MPSTPELPAADSRPVEQDSPPVEPPAQMDQASPEPLPQAAPEAEATVGPEPAPPLVALSPPPVEEPKAPDQVAVLPPPEKPVRIPEPVRKPLHEEKTERKPAPPKVGPKASDSKPAQVAMAPNRGMESDGAREGRATWLSQFIAHMRRYNTYKGITESGTVRVSITLDRNGRVRLRRVVGSSGSPNLDRIALDIIERAQPYPPFPASMPQAEVVEVVPLHLKPQ